MNVNEVPQDPKKFKGGDNLKKVVYALDKNGKYTGVNSSGWDAENFALQHAFEDIDTTIAQTAAKVQAGELSPLPYFMQKNLMDIGLLAKYAGKWKWQVKRHFKPEVFNELPAVMLDKYAAVFNITTNELVNFGKDKHEEG